MLASSALKGISAPRPLQTPTLTFARKATSARTGLLLHISTLAPLVLIHQGCLCGRVLMIVSYVQPVTIALQAVDHLWLALREPTPPWKSFNQVTNAPPALRGNPVHLQRLRPLPEIANLAITVLPALEAPYHTPALLEHSPQGTI